jgi:hypothetical protein
MKKILLIFLTVVTFGMMSGNALACPDCPYVPFGEITEAEAKMIVHQQISVHHRGWTVGKVTPQKTPAGHIHTVETTDAAGNKFFFVVLTNGNVKGPMTEK